MVNKIGARINYLYNLVPKTEVLAYFYTEAINDLHFLNSTASPTLKGKQIIYC
jgi:hypothetical protein